MKTTKSIIIAAFLTITLALNGHSQSFWEWTDPVPLTDSLSDNMNAYIMRIHGSVDELVYMAWEKSTDSASTAIYLDNILDSDPAEIVLSDPGIKYTNPILMSANQYPPTDSVFYLFYETDQNGSRDIYYVILLTDGSFSDPVAFASTPFDDTELYVSGNGFFKSGKYILRDLVWSSNGKIYNVSLTTESGQQSFSDPVIVDSILCSNPGFSEMGWEVYYLKEDAPGEKHIYKGVRVNNEWSTDLLYDMAPCENLKTDKFFSNYTLWSAYIDSSWRLVMNDYLPFYTFDIEKETPFDAGIFGNAIVVMEGDPFEYAYIAFPYPDNGHDEVYMNPYYETPYFENFTNSGLENRNTEFFMGEDENPSCFYIYLVWEANINGFWQIWSSKTLLCIGSIDEAQISGSFMNIHPNPLDQEAKIDFTLDTRSDVSIDIYNNNGMHISNLANKSFDQGAHQLRWNADGMAAGMYIIKMTVGDMIYTSKVVKSL